MTKTSMIDSGPSGAVVLHRDGSQKVRVSALLNNQTLWMTQQQMAEFFEVQVPAVSRHIKSILEEGELGEEVTISKMERVCEEGGRVVRRAVDCYNLGMVVAVGCRLNSEKAVAFRSWATNVLREYVIKGFAMDDERLKNPDGFLGEDYFEEMLERIGEIRASQRWFCQRITDIYSECSVDYDKDSPVTRRFFAQVRNKLLWADARQAIALDAENSLGREERSRLNRYVSLCLDYAENQAKNRVPMAMVDWAARLEVFLRFSEEELLNDEDGRVTRAIAEAFASEGHQLCSSEELRMSRWFDCDLFDAAKAEVARLEN